MNATSFWLKLSNFSTNLRPLCINKYFDIRKFRWKSDNFRNFWFGLKKFYFQRVGCGRIFVAFAWTAPCLNENRVFSDVFIIKFDDVFTTSGKTFISMTLVVTKNIKKPSFILKCQIFVWMWKCQNFGDRWSWFWSHACLLPVNKELAKSRNFTFLNPMN